MYSKENPLWRGLTIIKKNQSDSIRDVVNFNKTDLVNGKS